MAGPLTKAGRYEIVAELGRGSMGVVYQGFDPIIGRTVAIKTMLIEGLPPSEFEEYKQRFQREAQAAGVLTHPNIVTVYDFGEDAGVLFLAMEFLEGKSIQQLVEKHNIMPIETLVPMYEQICSALDHAHRHKIVHRDIKPANIMILESGLVKVTDFGIAKVMSMGMTQAGQILGTPNYMSPEQVKGRQIDGRSDIFSLGVILYELVTGEKPFGGQNITTVIYKIINEDPIPPRQLDATIHPGLSYVISKSLAKKPEERYQTCRELAEDLRNYKNLGGLGAPSATVIFKVPPIQAQQVDVAPPPPSRVEPRVAPPAVEPKRVQAPPPTPAPRETKPPAPAPVIYAAQPQQKSSSSIAWVVLVLLLLVGLGGGGLYYYKTIYLPQQEKEGEPSTKGPQEGGTTTPETKPPATVTQPPPSTTTSTTQPAATTTKPSGTETTTVQPVKPPVVTTETPTTTTTPSTKNGKISIASNVRGAIISIDGQSTEKTAPRQFDLSPGDYRISLSKDGYNSGSQTVTVKSGKTTSARILLAKAEETPPEPKPETPTTTTPTTTTTTTPANNSPAGGEGGINIQSNPSGLDVLVDGKPAGKTPLSTKLPPGPHTYSVTCPGEPYTKSFSITAGIVGTSRVSCN